MVKERENKFKKKLLIYYCIFVIKIFNYINTKKMEKKAKMIEELFFSSQFLKEFGINAEFDGIANLKTYLKSSKKIMWILKEANWGDDGGSDEMESALNKSEKVLNAEVKSKYDRMNEYYNNITEYNNWKRTFSKILYTNCGIITGLKNYNDMCDLDNDAKIEGVNYLENCIFLNLKKIPGFSSSHMPTIRNFYNQHQQYILKQISIANPDIIINASGIYELAKDLFPEGKYNNNQYYTIFNDKLVIDVYHPNARVSAENYVDNILKIVHKH